MSDLAEFLLARIAEDEADARRAASFKYDVPSDAPWERARARMLTSYEPHQARWSPARVLAECEAKRRIIAIHHPANLKDDGTVDPYASPNDAQWCQGCLFNGVEEYAYGIDECPTKRLLALPYADHAEFREEWRAE